MNYRSTDAILSACGTYRYALMRDWNPERPTMAFCMLNPSTADASKDDATIRKCVNFADSWGFGRMIVVNLFAFRATDPDELKSAPDPIGPDNDSHLFDKTCGLVTVCAWGSTVGKWPRPTIRERPYAAKKAMQGALLRYIRMTKSGHPEHPLYLPGSLTPQEFDR